MCWNWAPLNLVKHVVLIEFFVKIVRERAVICRECSFFCYNFLIGKKILFIFAHILWAIYLTNTILTIKKLTNAGVYKISLRVTETKELSVLKKKKNPAC